MSVTSGGDEVHRQLPSVIATTSSSKDSVQKKSLDCAGISLKNEMIEKTIRIRDGYTHRPVVKE